MSMYCFSVKMLHGLKDILLKLQLGLAMFGVTQVMHGPSQVIAKFVDHDPVLGPKPCHKKQHDHPQAMPP